MNETFPQKAQEMIDDIQIIEKGKCIGFEPLITLTEMWDEENPCLIMFKSLV